MANTKLKIATIDLYNNETNEGMRCIKEIVNDAAANIKEIDITYNIFETRYKSEIPDLSTDIFISSGGPGSPFEGEGTKWEKDYFNLLDKIVTRNENNSEKKKYIFFICHSFQMMARYFEFGLVNERHSKSFGVMPFLKSSEGEVDPILKDLSNPFYAADIRQYQVIEPNLKVIDELNGKILSFEIVDDLNGAKPAIAALRISNEIVGTQFHPEADPESMLYHFKKVERKKQVVEKYGEERYEEMINLLGREDTINLTRRTVIPTFLNNAINELIAVLT
jgi:GMP synthase-like glutamine amidotransferase